jgi:hypothetical protein
MNRALLIWVSVLAALQMIAGAAALSDLVGAPYAGAFAILVGAAQVGTVTYQKGLQTPVPEMQEHD